jgi:hypothetical protein
VSHIYPGYSQQQEQGHRTFKMSLIGLTKSPRSVHQHLHTNLEATGFQVETEGSCLSFPSDKVVCHCYVDDAGMMMHGIYSSKACPSLKRIKRARVRYELRPSQGDQGTTHMFTTERNFATF